MRKKMRTISQFPGTFKCISPSIGASWSFPSVTPAPQKHGADRASWFARRSRRNSPSLQHHLEIQRSTYQALKAPLLGLSMNPHLPSIFHTRPWTPPLCFARAECSATNKETLCGIEAECRTLKPGPRMDHEAMHYRGNPVRLFLSSFFFVDWL